MVSAVSRRRVPAPGRVRVPEGWAAVHPLLLSMGWTFRGPIVWHKPNGAAIKNAHEEGARHWPDVTEVCALYQRTCPEASGPFLALAEKMESERQRLGLSRATIDESMKTSNVSQYWWQQREWRCPTEEHWIHLQNLSGGFQWSWHQMKEWENQARSQYNASRPPFDCPLGVGNVWTHPTVAGPKRLRAEDGSTLHPCQKPLLFAERMIRASSRPGDTVWAPFGGTIREAVAAEQIARSNPEEARRVITAELNQDGRAYLGPSIRQLRGLGTRRVDPRQGQLFGGT